MKFTVWLLVLLLSAPVAFAADKDREEDRVKDAGTVLKEILNIPDNVPHDLLDRAECVIILPSVKKAAFGIGGSFGRGVMVCRGGAHYTGRWGAPALYALEGVSIGFQLGGQATDFVLLVMNPKGAQSLLSSKTGSRCISGGRPQRAHRRRGNGYCDECRDPLIFAQQGSVCRRFPGGLHSTFRWRRQREPLRKKAECERDYSRRQSRRSSVRTRA